MSLRITQKSVALNSLDGLYTNLANVNKLQQQLTTGQNISMPSDDPVGTNSILMLSSQQRAITQQQRNVTDGQRWMSVTDSALQNVLSQVQRVRTLAVQSSNTGSQDAQSEAANAAEVQQIAASLLAAANTQVQGRPVFGGITGNTAAYDGSGNFIGASYNPADPSTQVSRRISSTETVRIDVTGEEAFGTPTAPGGTVFSMVNSVIANMQSNPSNLLNDVKNLDIALGRLQNAQASVGARSAHLDQAAADLSNDALTVTTNLSSVQDVDMPKTIMKLQEAQTTYQAALAATAKIIMPSLADYLR